MHTVTVIGTGNIGSAVAQLAAQGGASVQIVGRDAEKAVTLAQQVGGTAAGSHDELEGDIIVLAIPYGAIGDVVSQYRGQLDGKVVVDVSNPVDFSTFDSLTVPADSSAAAELQSSIPGARVVKAFNTTFAGSLASGQVGDSTPTVLIAGDDQDAKQMLVDLVRAGGLDAVAVGSLKRARELEALAFLQMTLAAQNIIGWTGGFALRK